MICGTNQKAISSLWVDQKVINLTPPYQREGGVWSREKKQLFIDSILNKFDIPKFYFHDLRRSKNPYQWAVIDGKQRVNAICEFMEDGFPLSVNFKFTVEKNELPRDTLPKGGQYYSEFSEKFREYFKSITLDIVNVETTEEQDIEELFSRLNNGEPLNAAEKRNAKHGAMVQLIRDVANDRFFKVKLGFNNKRGSYSEVAAKFLLLEITYEHTKKIYADLKKRHLDSMVEHYAQMTAAFSNRLHSRVIKHLRQLEKIFDDNDPLLTKQSYPQLYYAWIRELDATYYVENFNITVYHFLEEFNTERILNSRKEEDKANSELIEFGRLSQQGTNDLISMEERARILTKHFLIKNPLTRVKDRARMFTDDERYVIWILANKKCASCRKYLRSLKDMHADHVTAWIHGGPTSFENAQCLCITCNLSKGKRSRNRKQI